MPGSWSQGQQLLQLKYGSLNQYLPNAKVAAQAVLWRFGEDALRHIKLNGRWVKLLDDRLIAQLRWDYLSKGLEWPYEHIWPGIPDRFMVAYRQFQHRLQQDSRMEYESAATFREQRIATIKQNMAQMDKWMLDYQRRQHIQYDKVSVQDRVLLNNRDLRRKYLQGQKVFQGNR